MLTILINLVYTFSFSTCIRDIFMNSSVVTLLLWCIIRFFLISRWPMRSTGLCNWRCSSMFLKHEPHVIHELFLSLHKLSDANFLLLFLLIWACSRDFSHRYYKVVAKLWYNINNKNSKKPTILSWPIWPVKVCQIVAKYVA